MSSSRIPNSSPLNRATVSEERTACSQARSGRGEQVVAGPVAQALVDQLEAVEVEGQDRGERVAAAALALGGLPEPVQEQQPVGQPGQRVVQGPVADVVVGGLAVHDIAQDVGQCLHEVDVPWLEVARMRRVHAERPERAVAALDHHHQPAAGTLRSEHGRAGETASPCPSR